MPDPGKSMSNDEQIKLEYATLMAQYNAARDEINGLLDASRQMVNLTVTAISVFLGVLTFVEAEWPLVFLILPFFLYGLVWVQLRHILLMRRLSRYIATVIAPRVREIVAALGPATDTSHLLSWEASWQSPGAQPGGVWLLPVLGTGYGLPLLAAVTALVAYPVIVDSIPVEGWLLMMANVIALAYSLALGYMVEFRRFGQR
jgi:hypothetical protein